MAIDTSQGHDVTVTTLVGSVLCQNVLRYFVADNAELSTSQVLSDFVTNIVPMWDDCISNAALLQSIRVDATTPSGHTPYPPAIAFVNIAGTRSGECLPPFVSARLYKVPNVSAQEPATPVLVWRNGMVRIAGISESDQNAGVLSSAIITNLNTLAAALESRLISGQELNMYYKRLDGTDPFYVPVSALYAGGVLGTQNTRKL